MLSNTEKKNMTTGNEGFTFIEIVFALSVFSIGVLGVTLMQTTAIQSNNAAMRTSRAIAYASDQMEKVLRTDFEDLSDGFFTEGPYTVTWTIDPEDQNMRKVKLKVEWSNQGSNQTVNFEMIRNKEF